ncbi:MAG: tRNA uridine-5-carboxymethylaminomethyl(34) synthesis GTPase MnmE [Gemmatimonadaceae bacterium]
MSAPLFPGGEDTIVAIATAPGRGAIALLRVSGRDSFVIASRVVPDFSQLRPRMVQLTPIVHPLDRNVLDHGLVTIFEGPRSYTGEDVVEVSVHGGAIVPTIVLDALVAAGARQALPGEFTRRAVANGRMDLLQAEAVADLVDARTRMAHQTALAQLEGGLSRHATQLRSSILDLEALIAYDIDFPEEDEGTIDRKRVDRLLAAMLDALDVLLGTADIGEVVRDGALVVIGGAPNAGKSSLFNALVGRERAIVTDIPGTTRDAIEAMIEVRGWPIRLVDTAGLRESSDVVERLGIEIAERYLTEADIVLLCSETVESLAVLENAVRERTSAPVILIRTKADLEGHSSVDPVPLDVSAVTGQGLEDLSSWIAAVLDRHFGALVGEAPLLTRARHRQGVGAARRELAAFGDAWNAGDPPSSVAAIHLRQAAHHLSELIGTVDVDDVLGRLFSTFCVGK